MINAAEVKRAASGRWIDVLTTLGGIPRDVLDGRHHPCPFCKDGIDRFRLIDVNAGAVICSQCFSDNNGDGLAAICKATGKPFPSVLQMVADYLGMNANGNGKPAPYDVLATVAREKRIPLESLKAYGATEARRGNLVVCRVPVWNGKGEQHSYFDLAPGKKGWCAPGKGTHGVFLPGRIPAAGETWIIVEGVKDAAALHGMGYLAAGMPTNKLATSFVRLFRGVYVVLMPDRDIAGESGAKLTSSRLRGAAARVQLAVLPVEFRETDGADVRDVLHGSPEGAELVRRAIDEASDVLLPDSLADLEADGLTKYIADLITEDYHFAQDVGGKMYAFRHGVYKAKGEDFIRRHVKRLMLENNIAKSWSPEAANRIVEFIRVDAHHLWESPPGDVLNVKNGLLDVHRRELSPHSHEHLSVVQLPVEYDQAATCPAIEDFVAKAFPEDATIIAWELAAWLMLPDPSIQKAVLLIGEGGNGKSTFLTCIANFLGATNTSAISLHKLEADRFAAAGLLGKLANICPDLPSEHLSGTSVFKSITGGDPILAEYKFRDAFDFTPFARLVFSANHPPRSQDSSQAFFDRWLVLPFNRRFRHTAEEISRGVLNARLAAPSELAGLLNKALDALPELRARHRFTMPQSVLDACQTFHATTDPLAVWLDRFTVEDVRAFVPTINLRSGYNQVCEQQGRPALTDTAFGLAFKRFRPHVEIKQRTYAGKIQKCYMGIGLVAERPVGSPASSGSSSYLSIRDLDVFGGLGARRAGNNIRGKPGEPDEGDEVTASESCPHSKTAMIEGGLICTECGHEFDGGSENGIVLQPHSPPGATCR